jgi:preprotein translocase subunit SecE
MKNITKKIKNFFQEVKVEMKKVNWPTKKEAMKYTFIVLGTTLAVATYLGALDFLFTNFFLEEFII